MKTRPYRAALAQGTTGQTGQASAAAGAADKGAGTGATTGAATMKGRWDAATFKRLDKSGDGMLSRKEAQADPAVSGAWSKLDTANKGTVSREDFERYGRTQE